MTTGKDDLATLVRDHLRKKNGHPIIANINGIQKSSDYQLEEYNNSSIAVHKPGMTTWDDPYYHTP